MKQLINKIIDFNDHLKDFDFSFEQDTARDELNKLKLLFADILNHTETINKKQSDALEPYESRINLISEIVFEIDLSGNFIYMNDYGIEKLELNLTDIEQGKVNMAAVIHPDDLEKARASILNNSSGKRTTRNEYRLISRSGRQLLVQIFNSPIFEKQKMTGLRGIAIDVSERKKNRGGVA